MKLLFINQHYGMESAATGVLLRQLSAALVARGHEVTVISGTDGQQIRGLYNHDVEDGVNLVRVQDASIGDKTAVSRLWHYASYIVLATWAGIRTGRPDAVVTLSTPPLLAPLLARILAWYHKVPYYYNIQDLYPDVATASGHAPTWMNRIVLRMAKFVEDGAAGVSVVGRGMARQLAIRYRKPIVYLPNWADTREICPLATENSFRKLWGLDGKFVVLYSGNLGVCHDSDTLADAIELLRNQPVEFVFVVGPGARRELQKRIGDNPHVHFKPFQPREALGAVLATADVGLVTLSRGMGRFVVPCKTFGIMAAGRPLLAVSDLQDDLFRLVSESKSGVWAPAGDAPAIARAVLRLQQQASVRLEMGRHARLYVEREYNLATATRAWLRWLTGESDLAADDPESRMAA